VVGLDLLRPHSHRPLKLSIASQEKLPGDLGARDISINALDNEWQKESDITDAPS